MSKKVVTFGEIMLRLKTCGYERFVQTDHFEATYGGSESNVAVSLAQFGVESCFVTKLPENEIGQAAINSLRKFGVDTKWIVRGGERTGIYYLETGASQRPSKVIYDRADSAFAGALGDEFLWDDIFDGADWFHFSGITPALGKNIAQICESACIEAKKRNITISCDLNYRTKLWSMEQAEKTMETLCEYIDVFIANEQHVSDLFGINASPANMKLGRANTIGYQEICDELVKRFKFKSVAITIRESLSADDNRFSAMLYQENSCSFSKQYSMHIVDRVGGGDSFAAGLIYALLNDFCIKDAIEFSVAAGCLKHSICGDYNLVSAQEVFALMGGDGSGRVQR